MSSTDDTNAAARGSALTEGLGPLLPEREGQPLTLEMRMPWEYERGHWYSPAAVREMLDAQRERIALALEADTLAERQSIAHLCEGLPACRFAAVARRA